MKRRIQGGVFPDRRSGLTGSRQARVVRRRGFTLGELMIAQGVVCAILAATALALQRGADEAAGAPPATFSDGLVQRLFTNVEQRLDFSRAAPFSDAADAPTGSRREPRSVASPIANQANPSPGTFHGRTDDGDGALLYRGDGTRFGYQRPVDPSAAGSYVDGGRIRWGATVSGVETEGACACLAFRSAASITEAERGFDINQDGDLEDTFDLGTISDLSWSTLDRNGAPSRVDLGSPVVLQERGRRGSDLDGNGFEDPIFLWTPESGRLRIRLFALLRDAHGREVVRRFETTMYLRNGANG